MKATKNLFTKSIITSLGVGLALGFSSCKKDETPQVSKSILQIGQPISSTTLGGISVKGTMLKNTIYKITGDITVNDGDTLLIQEGVTLDFQGNFNLIVKGNLFSLGSKENQIYITAKSVAKQDNPTQDKTTDNAYKGTWGGILGDVTTKNMIIKWTHVEFGCGKLSTSPVYGIGNNKPAYMISFVNPDGLFVLEDSWIYGGVDDPIRIQGGKVHIMRNTFEKGGLDGGEGLNIKSGTVGNVAYNLFIGMSTNGIKPSNDGGRGAQTNICAYNNTIINCGYRRAAKSSGAGRGGSINFESGARGIAYNNLMVNCLYGIRIIGKDGTYAGNSLVGADTANIKYGNNMSYVETQSLANQIYPNIGTGTTAQSSVSGSNTGTSSYYTKPQLTDIPLPSSFLPNPYTVGQIYTANSTVVGLNNPNFVAFSLPASINASGDNISYATGFNFRLQSGSPAIGKGVASLPSVGSVSYPLNNVSIDANYGATEVTPPSIDLGAYSSSGAGNQH